MVYDREEREPSHGAPLSFHTLASNNLYANQIFKRNIKNMLKFNSMSDMTKNLVSQLPMSSQSFTTSPYLDHSLFSYDDKLISNLERPKPIGDQIIRFNLRDSGRLSFRIYPGLNLNLAWTWFLTIFLFNLFFVRSRSTAISGQLGYVKSSAFIV